MANTTQSIFTIYDAKAKIYERPFFDHNPETAKRQFGDLVNNETNGNPYHKYPQDFSLFYWGEFDCMGTPFWNLLEAPTHICNAIDLKEVPAQSTLFPMTNSPTQHGESVYETKETS